MTALNILLGIVAAVLLLFIVGQTPPHAVQISKEQRVCSTIAFVAVVALIIALNTIM
jgi:hypothetical protein